MPTTNSGKEVTASAIAEKTWSNSLSLRSAAYAPRTRPTTVLMIPAATTNTAEFTSRWSIVPQTAWPLASETPRFPVNNPESQCQYCTKIPSLR